MLKRFKALEPFDASGALHGVLVAALLAANACSAQQPVAGPTVKRDICATAINDPAQTIDDATRERFTKEFNDEVARGGGALLDVFDRPPKALYSVPPRYPAWARRCEVQSRVIVELVIGPEGEVVRTRVLGNPPRVLADAAVLAVRQWRFQPQTLGGEPTSARFLQPFNFLLTPASEEDGSRAVIGHRDLSAGDEKKSLQLSYAIAQLESDLGPGVRVVNMQTMELPLVDYARSVQSRMDSIEAEEGTPLVNQNLRVALTVNADGSVADVRAWGAANEASQQRAEQAARRAAALGPLPRTPGGEIKKIVFVLPFAFEADRGMQMPSKSP
ncbi:energy transducer TonB [Variovorax sp. PAMC26660]|uniref:energy transducer TonB n=1 Tax=Variovorax sp. PAMC26660 TaxID=2762322 RepID=UPI00164DC4AC|nr:energy transducer TonB [Variovorax sp. PAMC26660]QNK66674.1 energy transducer TonB [Variovorax sp. PAMC26660]